MQRRDNYLFTEGDLAAALRSNLERVPAAVDEISKDQLFATPETDLLEHIFQKLRGEPIEIFEDHIQSSERESSVDVSGDPMRFFVDQRQGPVLVPGYEIEIEIPYIGEPGLWKLRPSTWKSVFPHGDLTSPSGDQPGSLCIRFSAPVDSLDEEKLKAEIERELDLIRFYVDASSSEVEVHNKELRSKIQSSISARKNRLNKTEGIASRLGIPTKRNPNAPEVEPIRIERKLVRPLPEVSSGSYEPEYGIDDGTYEHILAVIRHELATFEATPNTYSALGEEDLRNILLAHLNGHYEGGATGETFRKSGKTDIRIEAENRAAFVAECKLWSGPKGLASALDQLLGYLTWRDCKSALVIFNKTAKNFSSILEKCPAGLRAHQKFKRTLPAEGSQAEWRFCFESAEDEAREIIVHVIAADLFVANDA